MPLFELEEGTSRKFYRIELDGTRVGLNWGRIGYDGTHESLHFETESEARTEYERQIARRRERGYREVFNLDAPHDTQAERDKRLATATPLSENPRFLFEHHEQKQFVWLEARGEVLLRAEGPVAKESETVPHEEPHGSGPAAVAARDRAMAELVERGFQLEQFGNEARAKPRRKPVLQRNLELEAAVADDPFDGGAWMVLEDWLLEVDDPRAAIIHAEQLGRVRGQSRRGDVAETYGQLVPRLLGQRHVAITKALEEPSWRAGYLLAVRFNPKSHHGELLAHLLASPAAPLLRALELCVLVAGDLAPMLEHLGTASCARSLRELTISPLLNSLALDGNALANLRLERLAFKNFPVSLGYAAALARLRRLELLTDVGLELLQRPLTELRTLVIDAAPLERNRWHSEDCAIRLSELTDLLDGTTAPRLENLQLANARPPTIKALVKELAPSKLLAQLRTLDFGGTRIDGAVLGAPFAHLEVVRLPDL